MWLVAPDGLCVGTGRPAARGHGMISGENRRVPSLWERARQTSGAFPSYGRRDGTGPPGCGGLTTRAACHDRRVMSSPPVTRVCPWPATTIPPPGASPAGRPMTRSPAGQPALVGRRRARLSRRARRRPRGPEFLWCPEGCGRPTRTSSGTSPAAGCWRSAAARPLLPLAAQEGADVVALDLSAECWPRRGANRDHGLDVPLLQADAGALPLASGSVDIACSAFGGLPFVADPGAVLAEVRGCCGPAVGSSRR